MENIVERISELSESYGVDEATISSYLNVLMEYPFIANGDEEKLFLCLARIVSEVSTQSFLDEITKATPGKGPKVNMLYRSVSEIFSEMILRTYGEDAFSYLNDEFLSTRNLRVDSYDDYDDTMSDTEREYQGYSKR